MFGKIISAAFHFQIMVFAIDVIHECGPSNEMCHKLQLNKNNVTLYEPFLAQDFLLL